MALNEQLADHLAQFQTAPFLFVGSGMSRRYLGLESWEALLEKFSALTDLPYAYYRSQAESDLASAASLMAKNFSTKWWSEDSYANSRKKYENLCTSERSPLKIEICRYLTEEVSKRKVPAALSDEISALRNVVVDGIITTNWDSFIESIFPDFRAYVGQDQLLFGSPQGIAEIYKIHGSSNEPNSLVLTKEDYSEFERKNPYLAAKLLTTFIEHPVIFMGYSLSDKNILSIIGAITGCLNNSTVKKLQDRLIFVEWDGTSNSDSMVSSVINQGGVQIPVKQITTSGFVPIYKAMSEVQRRFPAQVLRRLKDQVYDLVLNNDPKGKLYVKDINDTTPNDDIDVVFGVGAIKTLQERGYVGLRRDDLMRDIVFDDGELNAEQVLTKSMEGFLQGSVKFVPIFKYLREAKRIDGKGGVKTSGLPKKVEFHVKRHDQAFFHPPLQAYRNKFNSKGSYKKGIAYIESKLGVDWVINIACFLNKECVDCGELREFLQRNFHYLEQPATRSAMARLICFYDWICYGPDVE
ncbi:SIR2 family protein [Azospirillum brasilense]|uniref:Uncharacterized protein n=1 Tax=Azospirillum brasilense TaxID=192 RepID=A0A235H7A2_AZOBR|nr:SIR2 family protein [Azospirillum brasilense]OYD81367.1 hypothetical protein CHT98_26700 [Azospirillum brasilense]